MTSYQPFAVTTGKSCSPLGGIVTPLSATGAGPALVTVTRNAGVASNVTAASRPGPLPDASTRKPFGPWIATS